MPVLLAAPPNRIAAADLNGTQRAYVLGYVLPLLGAAGGHAEPDPAIPYRATESRAQLTADAATVLGITVTPGADLAQCYGCLDVIDGAATTEQDGVIRCDDCHHQHQAADPDYGRPDTTLHDN